MLAGKTLHLVDGSLVLEVVNESPFESGSLVSRMPYQREQVFGDDGFSFDVPKDGDAWGSNVEEMPERR